LTLDPPTLGSKTQRFDIAVGDVFINYVKGEGRIPGQWVSAERIIGDFKYEGRRIYDDGIWPYRWPVEPITPRYVADDGIVARDLISEMELFAGQTARNWGSPLRSQGREISRPDGELLISLLSSGAPMDRVPNNIPPHRSDAVRVTRRKTRQVPLSLRYKVLKRDDFRCVKCGRSPAMEPGLQLHVDHVTPWSEGGDTVLDNLQCLCAECNLGKSNRDTG